MNHPTTRVRRRLERTRDGRAERRREAAESFEERRLLDQARDGRPICWDDDDGDEPLVTVRIATYDRGRLVAERALASVIAQTYQRLEILVIGDHCDAATSSAVASVDDPRIRFINLPTRGMYPQARSARNKVAGAHPMNAGLPLVRGTWIAPCDDDDEFTPTHVEALLRHAKQGSYEMVYSKANHEIRPGEWRVAGSEPLRMGEISHGSVLYSAGLRFMRHSSTSWKIDEPSDWNLWKRMQRIGVRIGFLDEVTYTHYAGAAHRDDSLASDRPT